jgi:hypothetical protein
MRGIGADGRWMASVHVLVKSGDSGFIIVDLMVRASAVRPRGDGTRLLERPTGLRGRSATDQRWRSTSMRWCSTRTTSITPSSVTR